MVVQVVVSNLASRDQIFKSKTYLSKRSVSFLCDDSASIASDF